MAAPPSSSARISVVMITMNEEKAVGRVIGEIRAVAPEAEILLVDSSKDRTAEIAGELGARVIKQFPPKGYGPAMDLALRSAEREVVVTLDCDGSYPAAMIPVPGPCHVAEDGYDPGSTVSPGLKGKPGAMRWINYLANLGSGLMGSILVSALAAGPAQRDAWAYRRTLIHELRYSPKGAALPVELLTRPIKMGRKGEDRPHRLSRAHRPERTMRAPAIAPGGPCGACWGVRFS